MASLRRSLGRRLAGAATALATVALVPAPASGQEAAASVEPLLLDSPGPGYQQVPDGPDVGDPGPLALAEAAWMFDPDDPDPVQAVLLRLGYRTGHMRLWLDPAARRASGTLVMSFSDRVDAP